MNEGSIPWGDWQFWAVTLLALGAAAAVFWPLVPSRGKRRPCAGCGPTPCASNPATRAPRLPHKID